VFVIEFCFDVMFSSNFGNENSNTDHVKCSRGSNAGHRFPTPALDKHCSISLILLDGSGTQWLLPCGIGFMAKRMSEVFMHWLFPWLTAENLKLNWAKMIPDEGNQIAFLDTVLENPIRIVNGWVTSTFTQRSVRLTLYTYDIVFDNSNVRFHFSMQCSDCAF